MASVTINRTNCKTLKGEMQKFWVIDFIALLDKDTQIIPKNWTYDAQCVTVFKIHAILLYSICLLKI